MYQFVPYPQLNVVYRDESKLSLLAYNVVGGRELPILVMPSGIVPKIPYQRIFVPSDPGVPRIFVVDCSYIKCIHKYLVEDARQLIRKQITKANLIILRE